MNKKFSVSVPEDLLKKIKFMAKINCRSTNGQILHMIITYMDRMDKEDVLK